jgi:hypothetical protein
MDYFHSDVDVYNLITAVYLRPLLRALLNIVTSNDANHFFVLKTCFCGAG